MKRLLAVSLGVNGLVAAGLLVVVLSGLGLFRKDVVVHAEGGGGAGTPSGNGDVNGDEAINISDAVYILNFLFLGGPAPEPIACPPRGGGALPATGQTRCYDTNGREIDCERTDWPWQDGLYQAGCPSAGRFTDNGDGTVTDHCTGLMWQKDTAPGTYTWEDALKYCEGLYLGGHSDWRLPNVRELQSIVDYAQSRPSIDRMFQAVSSWYCSSSPPTPGTSTSPRLRALRPQDLQLLYPCRAYRTMILC